MEDNAKAKDSLHEIASLLLMIHDFYLSEAVGPQIIISLAAFIHDVGLDVKVSVLDIERCRRQIMGKNLASMGYEVFYDWLRIIASLIYPKRDKNGRKALHQILTEYIIPATADWENMTADTVEKREKYASLSNITERTLRVYVDYSEFFLFWYHEIIAEVSLGSLYVVFHLLLMFAVLHTGTSSKY
jgi:hypothetical protein